MSGESGTFKMYVSSGSSASFNGALFYYNGGSRNIGGGGSHVHLVLRDGTTPEIDSGGYNDSGDDTRSNLPQAGYYALDYEVDVTMVAENDITECSAFLTFLYGPAIDHGGSLDFQVSTLDTIGEIKHFVIQDLVHATGATYVGVDAFANYGSPGNVDVGSGNLRIVYLGT